MGAYSHIDIKKGWAEVVIDRPDRRNSLVPPLFAELTTAFRSLSDNTSIAAIILRGAEGYFCSGIDLKALQDAPPEWQQLPDGSARAMHLALYHCEVPVIMALERFAINAGASLALAGDLIVAGDSAFLQIGEIQQGVGIPMNAAWLKIKTTEQVAARLAILVLSLKDRKAVVSSAKSGGTSAALMVRLAPVGNSAIFSASSRQRATT